MNLFMRVIDGSEPARKEIPVRLDRCILFARQAMAATAGTALLLAAPVQAMVSAPPQDYLTVEAHEASPAERTLAPLFSPSFQYRDITVTTEGDRRLVTITSDRGITSRNVRKLNESLISRGISIYGAAYYGDFAWDRTILDAAITMTRKVEGEPDTIEISDGTVRDIKTNKPLVPLTAAVYELHIPVSTGFATSWKKQRIIPAVDIPAPEPRTGRFPGSRVFQIRENEALRRNVLYAVKGELREVEQFFDRKLKEIHRTVIVAGDVEGMPAPAEVFGIKTSAQVIVLSGYSYVNKKLVSTEVTLRRAGDPNLSDYIEIEVVETSPDEGYSQTAGSWR